MGIRNMWFATVSFDPFECDEAKMFEVDLFKGEPRTKMQRMQSCYEDETTFNRYSTCLIEKAVDAFGQFGERSKVCDTIKGQSSFLNTKSGSHLREICYANPKEITKHLEGELHDRNILHEVRPFDIEICMLQTHFRPGRMVLCFPYPKGIFGHGEYSAECGRYNFKPLVIEYISPTTLALTIGKNGNAIDGRQFLHLSSPLPNAIVCRRIVFNLYATQPDNPAFYVQRPYHLDSKKVLKSSLPPNLIVIPDELLRIYGQFGLVADEVKLVVDNDFPNTFLFLRFGLCPNTLRCFFGFTPTIHQCNNLGGSIKKKDCSMEIQDSISTGIGSEFAQESGDEATTGFGAELELTKILKASASHQKKSHSNVLEKFIKNKLVGKPWTKKVDFFAEPGQITELWQLQFSCLQNRFFLPIYVQKDSGNGLEKMNQFPAISIGVGRSDWKTSAEDSEKNNEDWTKSLPETADGKLLFELHKGPCDHPLQQAAYNESKCNFFEIPDDLAEALLESIEIDEGK